jgi:AraC family transcriptional regulator
MPRSQVLNQHEHMKKQTFEDYRRRLLAVLIHIQRHLDGELSLEELAEVANFSPFHFHRIFHGLVGESVKEHVRRLRLERAAHQLRHTGQSVTEIALAAGYQTLESFTRVFQKMFQQTPSAFRVARRVAAIGPAPARVHFVAEGTLTDFQPALPVQRAVPALEVRFQRLPEMRVAFARHVGAYDETDEAVERLLRWAGPRGLLTESATLFGIAYDDPEVTPPEKLRYDAALEVPETVLPTGDVGIQLLPSRNYAVTLHSGPYEMLGTTYLRFCGEWLPLSGREVLAAPALEFYLNSPQNTPPTELRTEIYLPVAA